MGSRRGALILGAILAVALGLRLGHVLSQRGDVLFDHPSLDEGRYVDTARALIAGHVEDKPYWQPPGLVYALAATFEVAGPGLLAPRLVQVAVSVASCALLFLIGLRLFDERVGLGAAAIAAVHGVLVFGCGELLPVTWIVASDLLALWLVLRAAERRRVVDAAAAGLAIGVAAVFSPTIAPFAIVAGVLVRRPPAIAALALGVLLPIAPITVRNYRHGGELVVISANGGLNLFIGNNAGYRATFALRPGRHWDELTTEPARHGATAPGAGSAYFVRRVAAFAAAHPASEAALLARKLYLFVHGAEIPRDTSIYEARAGSPVIRALVSPRPFDLPDALLVPAALLGIAALWRERRRLAAPLGLLATIAAMDVAFFVTSRHRAPALPLLALFAAGGAAPLAAIASRWRPRTRVLAAAGALAFVALANLPTWETELSYAGEADFYRGLAARDAHDVDGARAALRRAIAANPRDARAWFELGNVAAGPEAIDAWRHAAALDPWDVRASRRLAQVLVRGGDVDGAIAALEASLAAHARSEADYAPDHLNLAFLLAERGRIDEAIAQLDAAARGDAGYVRGAAPHVADAARRDPAIPAAFVQALDRLDGGAP